MGFVAEFFLWVVFFFGWLVFIKAIYRHQPTDSLPEKEGRNKKQITGSWNSIDYTSSFFFIILAWATIVTSPRKKKKQIYKNQYQF